MTSSNLYLQKTKAWVQQVVIACNFCPFAGKPFANDRIRYVVEQEQALDKQLAAMLKELQKLEASETIETTLIIFPDQYPDFETYLDMLNLAEGLLIAHNYEGIFQVASFHPLYIFANSDKDDPANYTNRSPFPMIHLLREDSVSKAVEIHPDIDGIPIRNMNFAREKGLDYMKGLLEEE